MRYCIKQPTVDAGPLQEKICKGSSVVLSGSSSAATTPVRTSTLTPGTPQTIPDNLTGVLVASFVVPPTCALASAITSVQLRINHSYNADLEVILYAPNGQGIYLLQDHGGSGDNVNCTFQTGGTALPTGNSTITGTRAPAQAFSLLTGYATGLWEIYMLDDASGDIGTFVSATLNFPGATCAAVTSNVWSPATNLSSTTSLTPTANPSTTTSYTLTTTSVAGCSASDVVEVNVLDPAGSRNSPLGPQCSGTTLNFSSNPVGGDGSYTYAWSATNPTGPSGSSSTYSFAPDNNGTDNITPTVTLNVTSNGLTCPQTFTPTIYPVPVLNTPLSNQVFCTDDPVAAITLTGTPTSVSYAYSGGGTIGLTNASGVTEIAGFTATHTGLSPVTRTINVTPSANGCTGNSVSYDITVNPVNRISTTLQNASYCNGETVSAVTLNGSPSGVTFDVTGGASIGLADVTGVSEVPSFTATNLGSSPVVVTITVTPQANGCASVSQSYQITVNPTPTFNFSTTDVSCFGGNNGSINFNVLTGQAPFDYSRNGGTNYVNNQTSPYPMSSLTAGGYTLLVRDDNGCVSDASIATIGEPAAALSVTASNTSPYAVGVVASLSSAPAGGTPGYSYQWSGPASFTSALQNPTRPNTTINMSGTYRVTVTDFNGCTASASTVMNVYNGYVWLGSVSSDWNNNANWSFQVPDYPNICGKNAIIPAGTTFSPILNIPGVSVRNLTLLPNATLQLDYDLNVCGSFAGSNVTGTPSVVTGTGALVMNGDTTRQILGRTNFNTLRIDKGSDTIAFASSGLIEINTALEMKSGYLISNGQRITFKSASSTQCAVFDDFSSGFSGQYFGPAKAERAYDATGALSFGRHMMGTPIKDMSDAQFGAGGTPGYMLNTNCDETASDLGSPYGNVMRYDETNGGNCFLEAWENIKNTTLENARGYSVSLPGSGTISVRGTLNTNPTYVRSGLTNSSWSNYSIQGRFVEAGWHIIGNPYLAYLDLQPDAFNSDFDGDVYVWHTTGPNADSYVEYTPGVDAVIPPFGAFSVHKTAPIGTSSYRVNGAHRTRGTTTTFFRQNYDQELVIFADNSANGLTDRTKVGFLQTASNAFEPQLDALKPMGNHTRHTLYTKVGADRLARNILTDLASTSSVPMGFYPGVSGTYTLRFEGLNSFDPTSYVYLEDRLTGGPWHNTRNGSYTFTANSGDNEDRFVLHFTPAAQMTVVEASCQQSGAINMSQPGSAVWNYVVTDANGNSVANGVLSSSNSVLVNVSTGVYTVQLTDQNGYSVQRNMLVSGSNPVTANVSANVMGTTVNGVVDVMAGDAVTFECNAQGANNFVWNMGDGNIINGTSTVADYIYSIPGSYTVSVNAVGDGGCESVATREVSVNAVTSVPNTAENVLRVYSFKQNVYVDFTKYNFMQAKVQIYNLLGQELTSDKVSDRKLFTRQLNVTEPGYVVVKITSGDSVVSRKVLIGN